MSKKRAKKKDVDHQLLDSIFILEQEWREVRLLLDKSVEPIDSNIYLESIAQAKYLYLLREARRRKISAARYL